MPVLDYLENFARLYRLREPGPAVSTAATVEHQFLLRWTHEHLQRPRVTDKQTNVMLLFDMWKQLKPKCVSLVSLQKTNKGKSLRLLLRCKQASIYQVSLVSFGLLSLYIFDVDPIFRSRGLWSLISTQICVKTELCHRIFLVLHKVDEAGDSCLNDFCAHFLRKSVRKLNRIKCILCVVTYCMVWEGR